MTAMEDENKETERKVCIYKLVSTAIDACQRGCEVIRKVHAKRCCNNNDSNDDAKKDICVEYKVLGDPRSALTEADVAAQSIIVSCLRNVWGKDVNIVGEEDSKEEETLTEKEQWGVFEKYGIPSPTHQPLRLDLVIPPSIDKDDDEEEEESKKRRKVDKSSTTEMFMKDLCIYIDPMDGTREFVESRLANVQSLIGFTYKGTPVAGVAGLPFAAAAAAAHDEDKQEHEKNCTAVEVVYAASGQTCMPVTLGRLHYSHDSKKWTSKPFLPQHTTSQTTQNEDSTNDKIVTILSGDSAKPDLQAAMSHIRTIISSNSKNSNDKDDTHSEYTIRKVIAGGCGNKVLQAALSAATTTNQQTQKNNNTLAIVPKGTCSWDTAAPTAILNASISKYNTFGKVTDFFGNDLVYDGTDSNVENRRGALMSVGKEAMGWHDELCRRLKEDGEGIFEKVKE